MMTTAILAANLLLTNGKIRTGDPRMPLASGMIKCTTMARAKIAITLDEHALSEVDRLVRAGVFPNRSQAIEVAVKERLERLQRSRLATEAAKLDIREEQALADEGYAGEGEWPEY